MTSCVLPSSGNICSVLPLTRGAILRYIRHQFNHRVSVCLSHGRRSYRSWGGDTTPPTFRAKAYRGHNLGIIRSARRICPPPPLLKSWHRPWSVCLSVCLTVCHRQSDRQTDRHTMIGLCVSKRLNVGSSKQRHVIDSPGTLVF